MPVAMAIKSGESQVADALIDGFLMLRARVFAEQLKWPVVVRGGRERDEYDVLSPTYIVVLDQLAGRVIGGARLLPLSGPTMLNGPFSFLLENGPFRHAAALESSRFCIDRSARSGGGISGTNPVTLGLVSAILTYAAQEGIEIIATVTEVRLERLLRRQGLTFERLGPAKPLEGTKSVAGTVMVDPLQAARLLPSGWTLDLGAGMRGDQS